MTVTRTWTATDEAGNTDECVQVISVVDASLKDLQAAMAAGKVTSRQIVEQYLARIVTYDENLHATLSVNLDAVIDADRLDAERRAGKIRGPLHGIPIILVVSGFWTGLIDWFRDTLVSEGTISPEDMDLFKVLDKPQEVVDAIFDYYEHKSFEPTEKEQQKLLEL